MDIEKECNTCHIVQPIENYYNKKGKTGKIGKMPICRNCYSNLYKRKNIKPPRSEEKVKETPNLYWNELQRQDTFELMTLLGWKFNEENKKWWKEGLKDSDGVFISLRKKARRKMQPNKRRLFSNEQIKQIFDMDKRGLSQQKIALRMNTSQATIGNYLRRYDYDGTY